MSNWMQERMNTALEKRRRKGTLRHLTGGCCSDDREEEEQPRAPPAIDFSSNDYLGLAQSAVQQKLVKAKEEVIMASAASSATACSPPLGATGSRLLSGDSASFHSLERYLARVHRRPAALLFNSGYDANLSVVSALPCDTILYDEYVHNSLHMGMRLWRSNYHDREQQRQYIPFRHNSIQDLQQKLKDLSSKKRRRVTVLIESVYSMDGDVAPVVGMLDVAAQFGAVVAVDEAHGLGVYGNGAGVLAEHNCHNHPALEFSIFTFGKAAGCHGAVVCCSSEVSKLYLVNYAYPFIYSTALPSHSLITIRCAYETMTGVTGDSLRRHVMKLVDRFRAELVPALSKYTGTNKVRLLPSTSPIQALMIPGNVACTRFCKDLFALSNKAIKLYPIKSPTVAAGQERVRIILHAHNTVDQVLLLVGLIVATLQQQQLLQAKL